jgi:hypothetical protein
LVGCFWRAACVFLVLDRNAYRLVFGWLGAGLSAGP